VISRAATTLVILLAAAGGAFVSAQPSGPVDFVRDVQPIFRAHCISCHGSEMQMNGLRLDRRADAMRGSTQTLIGPGNADGSKLYHRIADTAVFTTNLINQSFHLLQTRFRHCQSILRPIRFIKQFK